MTTFQKTLVPIFVVIGIVLSILAVKANEFGVVDPDITPDYFWSFNYEYFNPTGDGIPELIAGDNNLTALGPNIQVIPETESQTYGTILTHDGGSFINEFQTEGSFSTEYSPGFSFIIPLYFNTLPTSDYTIIGHGETVAPKLGWRLRYSAASSTVYFESSPNGSIAVATDVVSSATFTTGTWYSIGFASDGSTGVTLTVNNLIDTGTTQAGGPYTNPTSPVPLFVFGDIPSTFVDVLISYIAFYNSTLTSGQLTAAVNDIAPDNTLDYSFEIDVEVVNSSTTAKTNFQLPIEISTQNLINYSYMEADLNDVVIIDLSGEDYDNLITLEGVSTTSPVNTSEYAFALIPNLQGSSTLSLDIRSGLSSSTLPYSNARGFSVTNGNDWIAGEDNTTIQFEQTNLGLSVNAEVIEFPDQIFPTNKSGLIAAYTFEGSTSTEALEDKAINGLDITTCNATVGTIDNAAPPTGYSQQNLKAFIGTNTCHTSDITYGIWPDISTSPLATAGTEVSIVMELGDNIISNLPTGDYTVLYLALDNAFSGYSRWAVGFTGTSGTSRPWFEYTDNSYVINRYEASNCFMSGVNTESFYFYRNQATNETEIWWGSTLCTASWVSGNGTGPAVEDTFSDHALWFFGDDLGGQIATSSLTVDEISIWNRELTTDEHAQVMHNPVPGDTYSWFLRKSTKSLERNNFLFGVNSAEELVIGINDSPYITAAIEQPNQKNTYSAILLGNNIQLWEGSGQLISTTTSPSWFLTSDDLIYLGGGDTLTFSDSTIGNIYGGDSAVNIFHSAEIRDDQGLSTEATAFELDLAPGNWTQTQEGSAANNWTWTGTSSELSIENQALTYQIQTDQTDITVITSGIIPLDAFEIIPTPDTSVSIIGDIAAIPVTVTPNPNVPLSLFITDAATSIGVEPAAIWFIVVYAIAIVFATAFMKTIQGALFAILLMDLIVLAGSMSGLYAYWMTGLTIVMTMGIYATGVLRKGGLI